MRFTTPLRYPGGKTKLARFIYLVFEENGLLDGHYVEPFAGGAGIAFSLLFHEYALYVHLNDLNRSIYAFWHSVLNETEEICRLINDTSVTMEEWRKQRTIQERPGDHSNLELGFSTFYMNRTNRSGIITGGVIGGKHQSGKWKLDARFNRDDLIARINKIALYKNRISLYNKDASDFIGDVLPKLPGKTLVYLDPPYFKKGKALYEDHYAPEDHASLAKVIAGEIKQNWIVSYDLVPEIREIYEGFRCIDYQLSYSAADRYKGTEIMIFDPNLIIPDVSNPAKIRVA